MNDTIVRAFELPVHSIESVNGDGWDILRKCWQEATCLANWGVLQLIKHDVTRLPGMTKLPPRPLIKGKKHKGLYGLATDTLDLKIGWAGACISAATILRDVERKYNQERYEVVWKRAKAPCTYRYPYPWPIHAQAWLDAGFDKGKPFIKVALPGGHAVIGLRGGPEFGRQLGLFKQVVDGRLPKLQLIIRQQGASLGCHRPTLTDNRKPCRVMVKMVACLPMPPKKDGRTLVLLTDPNAFLVAELDSRPAWVLNADHMRRGMAAAAEHGRTLQRLGEDAKAERRLGTNRADGLIPRLGRLCNKHRNRMASWTHETASHVVKFAVRQGCSEIMYLDRDKDFLPKFPWHELLSKMLDKCRESGIELFTESGVGHLPDPVDEGGEIDLSSHGDDKWLRITKLKEASVGKLVKARKRSASHPQVSVPCEA